MADLKLYQTPDGGQITITNGQPDTTDALETAVYLSLFTPDWWGNAVLEQAERNNSRLPNILDQPLNNQTRLDVIAACRDALAWLVSENIADRVDVDAEIPARGQLSIRITIYESQTSEQYRYSLNWDAQEASLA